MSAENEVKGCFGDYMAMLSEDRSCGTCPDLHECNVETRRRSTVCVNAASASEKDPIDYRDEFGKGARDYIASALENKGLRPGLDPKSRYYDAGGIEVADIIKAKLTLEEYRGWLKGNILKYTCRAAFKHEDQSRDIEKIGHYSVQLKEAPPVQTKGSAESVPTEPGIISKYLRVRVVPADAVDYDVEGYELPEYQRILLISDPQQFSLSKSFTGKLVALTSEGKWKTLAVRH